MFGVQVVEYWELEEDVRIYVLVILVKQFVVNCFCKFIMIFDWEINELVNYVISKVGNLLVVLKVLKKVYGL